MALFQWNFIHKQEVGQMWLPGHTFVTLDLKDILHLLFDDSKNISQILLPRLFWYLSPLPFFFFYHNQTTSQYFCTFGYFCWRTWICSNFIWFGIWLSALKIHSVNMVGWIMSNWEANRKELYVRTAWTTQQAMCHTLIKTNVSTSLEL